MKRRLALIAAALCTGLVGFCGQVAESRSAESNCYSQTDELCAPPTSLGPTDENPTVDPPPKPADTFPITGSNAADLVLLGFGLIGVGLLAQKLRKTRGDDLAPREEVLR